MKGIIRKDVNAYIWIQFPVLCFRNVLLVKIIEQTTLLLDNRKNSLNA